jgi:hypothetical protein
MTRVCLKWPTSIIFREVTSKESRYCRNLPQFVTLTPPPPIHSIWNIWIRGRQPFRIFCCLFWAWVAYSDWLRAERPMGRSSSTGSVKNFHFFISSRPILGPNQPPIEWVAGVKRNWRKTDHSPSTSAEVKKTWIYTSTPPYAFMACLISFHLLSSLTTRSRTFCLLGCCRKT